MPWEGSQQTHNVATTSLQCRCNVLTLQRRCNDVVALLGWSLRRRCNFKTLQRHCNDVVATLCVCWVGFRDCDISAKILYFILANSIGHRHPRWPPCLYRTYVIKLLYSYNFETVRPIKLSLHTKQSWDI